MECCNIGRSSSVLPFNPTCSYSRLRVSHLPSKLKLSKLRPSRLKRDLLVIKASEENGSGNEGFSVPPNKFFNEEEIGAEYGEGFETFRLDGPLKVDVDFLNEKLQEGFLKRIRYAMKPDEAFGLIFSWDNVLADSRALRLSSWQQLAYEEGKNISEDADVQSSLLYAKVDHVLRKVLFWENRESELERLESRLSQLYYENMLKLTKPIEGVKEWLDAVSTARIPCALVSCLDRKCLLETLHQMGLNKYFQAIVTKEDGMDSIAHRFLSAAVKVCCEPSDSYYYIT
ncbi:hypothetical protein AQUCO_00500163v1 [Aquilegia coerulea]|uniref:Uncharacterized protein n=1 Tax=Aquilegia coerulea TaxID=218851 RepID=A0A2G5EQN7_AQUCA|nr:hypothetical protein AQUCO_00500163v1 [Aquilegia coerulea]